MLYEEKIIETIPVGPLGLIPLSERLLHHRGKHTEIWFRRGKGRDQGVGARR